MPSSPFLATGPSTTRVRDRRADLLVTLAALALAFWVTSGMWRDPNSRAITVNSSDQALFEWLLAFGGHALTHGENPLYTTLINVPDGVNLAVNTSITVYAAVFAPLTYLIGPPATFLVILTLNLAATAVAWYWLLSRYLVRSRLAAGVGALFIAFCPAMVSHANAHLNWTAGWLVPLLIWGVFRLRRPGRAVTGGIVLGLLVAAAFSIAAEGLFFTALALGVFLAVWALHPARWPEVRAALPRMAAGLGVTALVAGALLAYPLWLHFLGPQRFHGTGFDPLIHSEDIAAYGSYPRRSLAGWAGWGTSLAPNPTEENSFFGVPLLVLGLACFALLWWRADRAFRATLAALGVTAVVFAVLSWGPTVKWNGRRFDQTLPFGVLDNLPVINAALPSRLALVVAPVIGLLLAYAIDSLRARPPRRRAVGVAWALGFVAALLPLVPTPLLTSVREPIPRFITSGAWQRYVPPDGVLTPLPLTVDVYPDGQRWQAYALAHRQSEFRIPAGFFLGPGGPEGRGRIGPVPRTFDSLMDQAGRTGLVPIITDGSIRESRADLRHWGVRAVVLPDRVHGAKYDVDEDALRRTATALLGEPERVEDVWLWRVPD
ncbi:YfhO family protein [Micromonospora sp. CMU55-4]|uniref:YfhO family protein n=1 Tax=Micromonospora sp. CMU55-4 TaxID=2717028 RepID=UPI001409886C|nr:YfhO family protein [Micromonospora sp. CMU55-4]NHO82218.1 YfhO family protein [Micromonospora sp. CMU55-4]